MANRERETRRKTKAPTLLSGGNPQIAKADGDAPVRAYIAAMPGWKRDIGKRHENDFDEAQMAKWVKQAAALPGWVPGQPAAPARKPRNSATTSKAAPKTKADWRGETLARMRALILGADPEMIEECKWRKQTNPAGVPVWSRDGIVCTGETYKNVVKLTFARGASLPDPTRLFNSSLEGHTRRAIDIHEGEHVDARAFKALVKAAVALNGAAAKKRR